jgi:hypothetical protein
MLSVSLVTWSKRNQSTTVPRYFSKMNLKKLESRNLGKQVEKFKKIKKGLQHSGALGADKAADGHVDVSGAPLVAVEAHLVLGTRCLDIPKIKKVFCSGTFLKKKKIAIFIASKKRRFAV